ncbi:MAG: hypothetical protein JO228_01115, partial [Xanthobacteraceae bacterium]|nr:hypothetical protein [Xanthobacteraceae bacterium]
MIRASNSPCETNSEGTAHWGAKVEGVMTEGEAPVTVHVVLLLGCSNGMKIPDADEAAAIRVPLPSVIVTNPEPLRLTPVTASQFGVVEIPVTEVWACAGDAASHRRQAASSARRLPAFGAKSAAADLHNLARNAGGTRMSRDLRRGYGYAIAIGASGEAKAELPWLDVPTA